MGATPSTGHPGAVRARGEVPEPSAPRRAHAGTAPACPARDPTATRPPTRVVSGAPDGRPGRRPPWRARATPRARLVRGRRVHERHGPSDIGRGAGPDRGSRIRPGRAPSARSAPSASPAVSRRLLPVCCRPPADLLSALLRPFPSAFPSASAAPPLHGIRVLADPVRGRRRRPCAGAARAARAAPRRACPRCARRSPRCAWDGRCGRRAPARAARRRWCAPA